MIAGLALFLVTNAQPKMVTVYQAPAGKQYAEVKPGGTTILPNGRFLTPTGTRHYTGSDLWNVLVNKQGTHAAGFDDAGLTIYNLKTNEKKSLPRKTIAPAGAFLPNGDLLISLGDGYQLEILKAETWESLGLIDLKSETHPYPYINDLAIDAANNIAYGVDISYQDVVAFDLKTRKLISRTPAGRQPYALTFDSKTKQLFVANIGIFNYSKVPPPEAGKGNPRGLYEPAFAFPSRESEQGVTKEGRTVPGLGSPYVPDAHSIFQYSVQTPGQPKFKMSAKTGLLIHAPTSAGKAVGGSAPNAVIMTSKGVIASNANNDTIQIFDPLTLKSIRQIRLAPVKELAHLRGTIPAGMALDEKSNRLYVCCAGINAIAAIDLTKNTVIGYLPTGWFPMQVRLSPDAKSLIIATQKGLGRGPRGALHARPKTDERYGLSDMPGMIQVAPIPTDWKATTQAVLKNNGMIPTQRPASPVIPMAPGKASEQIKYVVFITKENHTFDGIFGGLKGTKSEASYAEFGKQGWIKEKGKTERVPIMPNHIDLAEQFAISDNFYMEPQASGDGHRWLVGVYPSLWTTRVFYAGWNFRLDNNTPGRMVSFGSDGSQIPEDYLENGSMFEHLDRAKISFRNYGEGYELPRTDEGKDTGKSGTFYQHNMPMPVVLYNNTCFEFPAYNTNIPDVARAQWFIEDLEKTYFSKGKGLPKFINIAICNDHGDSPRPEEGYPYVASYMADNDLALGRIVEFLSHRPEWKNMAIFVTQDDSGGDDDSVDRHRSFVQLISPYAKRGYVTKDHTSIMSIIRTIYNIFGLPANNLFDSVATPLDDMFTSTPNYTPYKHTPVDPRVFVPEKAMDADDPRFLKRLGRPYTALDDPDFIESLRKEPLKPRKPGN
jgi:DNA-binding beta-propeller fold protein YncE/phospholipase C